MTHANDVEPAWDLEMELLTMPCKGGSVAQMGRLAAKIDRACPNEVPRHVKELGRIHAGANQERDLHRWVTRQPWRHILPELYDFEVAWTQNGIHETARTLSCFAPHETVASLSRFPELFEKLLCPPKATEAFWIQERTEWFDKHPLRE